MGKQKTYLHLMSGILVLLFGCRDGFLQAAKAEAGDAAGISLATLASELNTMKELLAGQRRQIETLQSALEKQQEILNKAVGVIEAKSQPVIASGATTYAPATSVQSVSASQEKVNDVALLKSELKAVDDSAAQSNLRLAKVETEVKANKKETDAQGKQLGNFNFSGDIRARVEPFFVEGAETRTRERFRLRFNVTGKISDEFSGGLSLATGSLDDPISTNQTLTGFFNRKSIALDKAYITYQPKYAKALRLDLGRFAYPWYRTPMTFDNDVNVEGLSETLSFNLKSSVFRNITVVGFQLPFNELADDDDSYILGGQIQTHFQLGSKVRLGLYGSGINILRANPIAVALGDKTLKPSLPNSNSLIRNSSNVVTGYANKFAYLDAILKLDFDTGARFPSSLVFNFVNNVRGSRERSGYWTELTVGKTKEANDIQLGYAFIRIEKDAVIGAWNESDLRSSTNVLNHKFSFAYQIKGNVTGQVTGWIGKLANPYDNKDLAVGSDVLRCTSLNQSGCRDNYLKRFQFDLIYKY